jgi:hypothetical protein
MVRRLSVVLVLSLAACGVSDPGEPKCPEGQARCTQGCVPLTTIVNCGACGNVCDEGSACVNSQCQVVPTCETVLGGMFGEVQTDAAGVLWGVTPRDAVTWTTANTTCDGLEGHPSLPTATELYRLSQDAALRPATGVTLWSATPNGAAQRFRVTIGGASTGATVNTATTATSQFTCVCVPRRPAGFRDAACYGPSDAPCFSIMGSLLSYDAGDRPALTKAGAIWECGQAGGRLPTASELAEAVAVAMPSSGKALLLADEVDAASTTLASWTTGHANTLAFSATADNAFSAFRCVGIRDPNTVQPALGSTTVQVTGPGGPTGLAVDASDQDARGYRGALDACANGGGHLASPTELAALVDGGLPGATSKPLWTGDLVSLSTSPASWVVATFLTTAPPAHFNAGTRGSSVVAAGTTLPFRCVYPPLDPLFYAPDSTACWGSAGCVAHTRTRADGATVQVFIDSGGRTPATFADAAAQCANLGAHLPTSSDLFELIRSGVNGTNQALWTSDLVLGASEPVTAFRASWSGVPTNYDPAAAPDYRQIVSSSMVSSFRCLWTNEVR